jgi:Leucine rich repeat
MDEKPRTTDPQARTRRRWYQFGLRTLLIFVTLAGCGFGWLGFKVRAAREQAAAVAAIQKLRGDVHFDYEFGPHWTILRNAKPPGPTWLRALLGDDCFRDVVLVTLDYAQVSDADMKPFMAFTKITNLDLTGSSVTNWGLEKLAGLMRLKRLTLEGTVITDAGLEHIKGLTELSELDLNKTLITDGGMEHLKGLTQLEWLNLDNTRVSSAGLECLKGLTKLKTLLLSSTEVSDLGLEHLSELTQLQTLDLSDTQITDVGLERLRGLTQLKQLRLGPWARPRGTRTVSKAGVKKLQQALPNCHVQN